MEKQVGNIRVTETDSGYRIDVEGKNLKDILSSCCVRVACSDKSKDSDCCSPESDKK